MLQPGEGETLKLGSPYAGDVVIKMDPEQVGGGFAAGTQTLSPGTEIPVHRHLQADRVFFIHKGQGRALVDQQAMTVLPGMTLFVPRQTWHSLRNTGTGAFQVVWIAAPAGIERFFRELAQAGGPVDAASLQSIAQRHGIELQAAGIAAPAAASAPSGGRHRRRHRGGRGRRGGAQPSAAAPSPTPPAAPAQQVPKPAPRPPRGSSTEPGPARRRVGGYRRRVKEVYMGGKWVKVEGEGPVISTD